MLPGAAVTVPFAGAVMSMTIVSLTGAALVFPHLSRYQTFTVWVPLQPASHQLFVPANASQAQLSQLAVLLMHIWIGTLASAAVSVSVTAVFRVAAAPPLIVTVPLGASFTAMLTVAVLLLAVPSFALKVKRSGPL